MRKVGATFTLIAFAAYLVFTAFIDVSIISDGISSDTAPHTYICALSGSGSGSDTDPYTLTDEERSEANDAIHHLLTYFSTAVVFVPFVITAHLPQANILSPDKSTFSHYLRGPPAA